MNWARNVVYDLKTLLLLQLAITKYITFGQVFRTAYLAVKYIICFKETYY